MGGLVASVFQFWTEDLAITQNVTTLLIIFSLHIPKVLDNLDS